MKSHLNVGKFELDNGHVSVGHSGELRDIEFILENLIEVGKEISSRNVARTHAKCVNISRWLGPVSIEQPFLF